MLQKSMLMVGWRRFNGERVPGSVRAPASRLYRCSAGLRIVRTIRSEFSQQQMVEAY